MAAEKAVPVPMAARVRRWGRRGECESRTHVGWAPSRSKTSARRSRPTSRPWPRRATLLSEEAIPGNPDALRSGCFCSASRGGASGGERCCGRRSPSSGSAFRRAERSRGAVRSGSRRRGSRSGRGRTTGRRGAAASRRRSGRAGASRPTRSSNHARATGSCPPPSAGQAGRDCRYSVAIVAWNGCRLIDEGRGPHGARQHRGASPSFVFPSSRRGRSSTRGGERIDGAAADDHGDDGKQTHR